jgi:urease accessory protein UreE
VPGVSLFRSIPVVESVCRAAALPTAASAYARDAITLGWEERLRVRTRRVSDNRFEFATTLPRGTVLHDGDCFVLDPQQLVIHVVERAEPVLVIEAASPAERAFFAYHIGNSHQPLMIAGERLVCLDSPEMSQVLAYHGIPFSKDLRSFTPVGRVANHRHAQS